MADISALAQIAPEYAAFAGGQNQQQERLTNLLKQRELEQLIRSRQQETDFAAQNQPGNLRHQDLQNQGLEAGLPGIIATSRQKGTEADQHALDYSTSQQTQAGNVAATNAENQGKVSKSSYEQYQRAESALLDAGPVLANTPPALRAQTLRDHLTSAGINPDAPQFKAIMGMDATHMPAAVNSLAKAVGAQRLQLDPQAQAHLQGAQIGANATIQHARISAGATIKASENAADSRLEVQRLKIQQKLNEAQDILGKVKAGKVDPQRVLYMAATAFPEAQTQQEKDTWLAAVDAAETAIRLKAQAGGEGGLNVGVGENKSVTLTPKTVPSVADKLRASQGKSRGAGTAEDPVDLTHLK